ncbi:MAG: hypothetical protein HYY40_04600 [Bacteroidetes bacterium]|nr:hypothetical protein [Bacteroidota bacterium]
MNKETFSSGLMNTMFIISICGIVCAITFSSFSQKLSGNRTSDLKPLLSGKLSESEFAVIYKTSSNLEFVLEKYNTGISELWKTKFTVDDKVKESRIDLYRIISYGNRLALFLGYVVKDQKPAYLFYAYMFDLNKGDLIEKPKLFSAEFDIDKTPADIFKRANFTTSPNGKKILLSVKKDYPDWFPGIEKKNIKVETYAMVWDENLDEIFNQTLVIDDNPYKGKEISCDVEVSNNGTVYAIRKEPPHKITVDCYTAGNPGFFSLTDSLPDVSQNLLKSNDFLFREYGVAVTNDNSVIISLGTKKTGNYNLNSYFIYKFNFIKKEAEHFTRFDLTAEFLNNVINPALVSQSKKPVKELETTEVKDVLLTDDSILIVIAEQSDRQRGHYYSAPVMGMSSGGGMTMYGGGGMTQDKYKSGNILLMAFDLDGKPRWQNIIAKKQYISFRQAISHFSKIIGNELLLISYCNAPEKDGYQTYIFRINMDTGKLTATKKLYMKDKREEGIYNDLIEWFKDRDLLLIRKMENSLFNEPPTILSLFEF